MNDPTSPRTIEHAEDFVASLGASPRTIQTYRQALRRLALCLYESDDAPAVTPYPLVDLDDEVLTGFFDWLSHTRNYQPRTVAVYLAAARRFLIWLDAQDLLPDTFSLAKAQNRLTAARGKVRRPSEVAQAVDPDLPKVVTYYDRQPLPASQSARLRLLRNRAIVHTLYASAGRVSEVASLTRAQVLDGRLDEVMIRGKGGKDRIILLTPEAQQAIQRYCQERQDRYPGLFLSHGRDRGKALGRWALWKTVKDAALALDLFQGTSPHDFRHFRARQLLHEGMDLEVLQVYLGHADVATTRRIYAPYTALAKVKDQLATYGRPPAEAAKDASP